MTEPDVATDYPERDVRAVRRVLVELGQVLGNWRDSFVVVGGAVPWLLLPDAMPAHIGTLDIDLALNPAKLANEKYAGLIEMLENKGYERNADDLKPFQLRRRVPVDVGEPIAVLVDFMLPRDADIVSNHPKLIPGFRAIEADGAAIALENSESVTIDGWMVDGRKNSVELQIATIPAFLAMKGHALRGRDKKKDAYDIYFCVRNFPGGLSALAELCRPLLDHEDARAGFQNIASKFRTAGDYGPTSVRRFLAESSALGEMTPAQVETDAYAQVSELVRALNISA